MTATRPTHRGRALARHPVPSRGWRSLWASVRSCGPPWAGPPAVVLVASVPSPGSAERVDAVGLDRRAPAAAVCSTGACAGGLAFAGGSCRGGCGGSLARRRLGGLLRWDVTRPAPSVAAPTATPAVTRAWSAIHTGGGSAAPGSRARSSSSWVGGAGLVGLVAVGAVETTLDDLQRQEVLALLPQDPAESLDVEVIELPVTRRRALGVDEALALEEPDLGDRQVGEVGLQEAEHLADRQVRAAAHLSRRLRGTRA